MRHHIPITFMTILVLALLGTSCAEEDSNATAPQSAPITIPATAAATASTAAVSSTTPPTSAADTTLVPDETASPAMLLTAFEPPAELGAGFTKVEAEGTPPPAAAWRAIEATGGCADVDPAWNVASADKLAVRNIQYLGALPTDLRSVIVFALTPAGADRLWQSFNTSPAQVATCWQEGIRVLSGISDITIVDAGGPTAATPQPTVAWRHQTVSSATFSFQAPQAFGMIRHGDTIAVVSLAGADDDATVAAIFDDLDERLASIIE